MKLETMKKDKKKKIIIGSMIVLSVVGCLTLTTTRAKYRNVQSLKLANGIVEYKVPDLKLAIKVSEDGENYTDQTEIPISGYTLNTEKSKCRIPTSTLNGENAPVAEGVIIEYTDGKINVLGVTKKDTRCYVYFDKKDTETITTAFGSIEVKLGTPDFTRIATKAEGILEDDGTDNNGIYKAADGMYDGSSYYWRGAATTNHVIFDNKCWRIVRINGDSSIRLIYNGDVQSNNSCYGNGVWDGNVVLKNTAYNSSRDNSSYVGWTYTVSSQRPSTTKPQTSGMATSLKTALESWYSSNITDKGKIIKGYFCNDRNTQNNETWRATGAKQYYAAYQRLFKNNKTPTLSCSNGDIYELNVGMITADEVQFAGASANGSNNTSYYLYNGQYYWTMTPLYWSGTFAGVLYVHQNGHMTDSNAISSLYSARPVINLRSDVTFNAGSDGTQNNPYIVQ